MFPLYDENRSSRRPYITWGLIILNVLVFYWQLSRGLSIDDIYKYGAIPEEIIGRKSLHTLITSMFMHGGLLHIAGNMLYLYIFGDNIEDQFGRFKYLILYLLFGVAGGITHSWFTVMAGGRATGFPAVGASGAISGVMGAYLVLFPNARIVTLVIFRYFGRIVRVPAFYYLGFWFLYQFLIGSFDPSVAFWAHIGGFVVGALVALVIKGRPREERHWRYY